MGFTTKTFLCEWSVVIVFGHVLYLDSRNEINLIKT